MTTARKSIARYVFAPAVLLLASIAATAGTITVQPTVTTVGSLFQYAYSISNTGPNDSFLIDIPVIGAIQNLVAPTGFKASFDSGLGLVSFLEDTSMFGPTPVSGFSFKSPAAPGGVMFQATLLNNSTGGLYTMSGPTTSPVPEPGYFALFLMIGGGLVGFRRWQWKHAAPECSKN